MSLSQQWRSNLVLTLPISVPGYIESCASLLSIVIPRFVTPIGHSCFRNGSALTGVALEAGSAIWSIVTSAFHGCASLSSIRIPRSVGRLPAECFAECRSLLLVTFEADSRLSSFEWCAFRTCTSLSSICIPSSVERICAECFSGCQSISRVTFEPGHTFRTLEIPSLTSAHLFHRFPFPPNSTRSPHRIKTFWWQLDLERAAFAAIHGHS
jgi:hypothetical protein